MHASCIRQSAAWSHWSFILHKQWSGGLSYDNGASAGGSVSAEALKSRCPVTTAEMLGRWQGADLCSVKQLGLAQHQPTAADAEVTGDFYVPEKTVFKTEEGTTRNVGPNSW